MVLRKITIDNSVRYIPQSEKTRVRESKPNTRKSDSVSRKQDKNISQNSKKIH